MKIFVQQNPLKLCTEAWSLLQNGVKIKQKSYEILIYFLLTPYLELVHYDFEVHFDLYDEHNMQLRPHPGLEK